MAFTLPTNYANALSSPFKENFLVRLYYDASNYTAIALYDQTVSSVSYTGCIINNPTIRQSIDLTKSTATTSNITLNCANAVFGSDKLSALLISGSNNYLNKKVEIYSILNDSTSSSDQIKLYTGRLQSLSMDDSRVKIRLLAHKPWDFINIPNAKSTNNVYVPIAYGDYTGNTTSNLTNSKNMYPAPFRSNSGNDSVFLTVNQTAETVNACFFDKTTEVFPHLQQSSQSATVTGFNDTKFGIRVDRSITRTYRIKPTSFGVAPNASDFPNSNLAYDDDNTTFTTDSLTTSGTESTRLRVNLPQISGKITAATMYIKADVTLALGTATDADAIIADDSFGASLGIITASNENETVSTSGSADPFGTGSAYSSVSWTSKVVANDNKLPDQVIIELQGVSGDAGSLTATAKVYDIYFNITSATNFASEPVASAKEVQDLEFVYIGADGYPSNSSWSGNTNALTKIHQAHRDIMHRFLDVTDTPTNYSDLDSARSSWSLRFWNLEPKSAKSILEKLQYEGGFIFLFNQDTPKYIFIPNSISADHSNVTKSQINNLEISHTGIGDLITKMHINYEKHPAKNEYLTTTTYTSSERGNFNFTTNESVAEVNLDALVGAVSGGSNRNDSFANYYDKINGTLKLLVRCDFVDPSLGAKVEVGDFVTFDNSNMATAPFGGAWTSKNFIVTSVNRKLGAQASVQLQEV